MELQLKTPSPDHVQFDDLCAEVDDFEPLPAVSSRVLERKPANGEETSLDEEILAGLVVASY